MLLFVKRARRLMQCGSDYNIPPHCAVRSGPSSNKPSSLMHYYKDTLLLWTEV